MLREPVGQAADVRDVVEGRDTRREVPDVPREPEQERLREVIREVDGKLTWRLTLKPGEKRDVSLKFSVEYPADLPVSGLE